MKYEKDGKVAVLVSPGFGAGWYTWNFEEVDPFDYDIAKYLDQPDARATTLEALVKEKYPKAYNGGLVDLEIQWLDKGTKFYIDEYDGHESIVTADELVLTA